MAIPGFVWYTCQMALPHLPLRTKSRLRAVPPVTVNAETPIPGGVLLTASFDGACSPNPGPMGVGYVVGLPVKDKEEPRVLVRVGAPIGQGTNNEAEWHALIALMRHSLRLGFWTLGVTSDSLLVVNQFTEEWKARGRLARLRDEALNLARLFQGFALLYTPREQNTVADALSHELVFEEPTLPPIPARAGSRNPKILQEWQAAAIRVWWHRHRPGAGTLSRVFGIGTSAIEAIALGKTYRTADFSAYPAWQAQVSVSPTPLVVA